MCSAGCNALAEYSGRVLSVFRFEFAKIGLNQENITSVKNDMFRFLFLRALYQEGNASFM